jgi:hypothetical protein
MQSAVHNVHNMQLCFQFCLHSVPYDESWIDLVLAEDDRRRALGTGHKGGLRLCDTGHKALCPVSTYVTM